MGCLLSLNARVSVNSGRTAKTIIKPKFRELYETCRMGHKLVTINVLQSHYTAIIIVEECTVVCRYIHICPTQKVLGTYYCFFTGELFYCTWLPLRPSLKEGPHADPGDCEGRNPCRHSPTQQKKLSGASPHPSPGGCPFQGPCPLTGLYPLQ